MSILSPKPHGLYEELLRDFPGFFGHGYLVRPLHGDPLPAQIKVDVSEGDGAYTVHADLPGVAKDDIHIAIEGHTVTLRAEVRQLDRKTDGDKVLRSERYTGAVTRTFQLGAEVDAGRAQARYADGVLTLTLPKRAPSGGHRVRVE